MSYKHLPAFTGISKDVPARLIAEDKCQDGSNVIFKDGVVKRRFGYKQLGSNLPLSGAVCGLFFVEFISFGNNFLIACTTTDAYKFDFPTGAWKFITQIITAGTVTVTGSTVSFTTVVDDTRYSLTSTYQIKFGSTDPNTSGTWYTVTSIASGGGTATIDGTASHGGGTAYCMRICFSGDSGNHFHVAQPFDFELNDKCVIITNGVDYIQRWDGSGYCFDCKNTIYKDGTLTSGSKTVTVDVYDLAEDMIVSVSGDTAPLSIPAGTTIDTVGVGTITMTASAAVSGLVTLKFIGDNISKAEHVGFYGSIGYEHTILANVTTALEGNNQQRIETSNAGEVFFEGTYYDLITNSDKIHGVLPLQSLFIVYKDKSITHMIPNSSGGNDDPFQFLQNKVNNIGTPAVRSVKDIGQYHIFYGHDNIYIYDGINIQPIGNEVINDIRANINRPFSKNIFAGLLPADDLYCLFVPYDSTGNDMNEHPNRAFVYDYKDKSWTIWDFNTFVTSISSYRDEYSPAWSSKITAEYSKSSETTSGSIVVKVNTTDLAVGQQVKGSGIPRTTATGTSVKIAAVPSATAGAGYIDLNVAATITQTGAGAVTLRYIDGGDLDEQGMRFEDLILYSNNITNIIGDYNGYTYILDTSYTDDDGVDIDATFTTKDMPLNDPKHTFKLFESVISFLTINGSHIKIRASVDFGGTWTDWIDVPTDGTATYKESLVNFLEKGRQVRFEIANVDSAYFEIESMTVGFNDMGISRDY